MVRMKGQATQAALERRMEDAKSILEKSTALVKDSGRFNGNDSVEPHLRLADKIRDLATCTIDLAKLLSDDCIDYTPKKPTNLMSAEASRLVHQVFKETKDIGKDDMALDAENAAGLRHILESFRDHLGSSSEPNMKFRVSYAGDSTANLKCDYTVNDRTMTSDYFAIDNIYFEMFQPTFGRKSP